MIPPEFEYVAPESLDDAIRALSDGGADAKLLAGGHSLLPLMKVRLAAPSLLVDLRRVPGLSGIEPHNGGFRIGAMTHHADVQFTPALGLASRAASLIADQQVRNRGTIGGSLAHADPAADMPAVLLALEGEVTVRGPSGDRSIAAADLFRDFLTTSIEPDEVLTEVLMPSSEGWGVGYQKFVRRAEDWATVGVCALVRANEGVCEDVRVGLTHMAGVPLRATAVEAALRGQPLDSQHIAQAAENAAEGTDPPGDVNATPEYKRRLARVLCRRALEEAAGTG
ncbi:MAG TPA: xanthine dehydrogenase family protein subunit M [Thermoleophilaceae bacterium]